MAGALAANGEVRLRGLLAGLNTYAYVSASPALFVDPDGLGKQGGQQNMGGDDPLMPRDINKHTPREKVNEQIKKIEDAIKRDPNMSPKRKRALRAWQKVASRGFTKSLCPTLLGDLVLNVLRESCLMGDVMACSSYCSMGGDCEKPEA